MSFVSPRKETTAEQVARLIARLHDTEEELRQLTHGEIDTVTDGAGRTVLLGDAQRQIQANALARQAAVLDALPINVALLDAEGVIVSINETWRQFAAANAMGDTTGGVGRNYLELCDSATGADCAEAPLVASGIRAVLRGESSVFSIEYPCHSPDEKRWFLLTAAPLSSAAGIVVMHLDVSLRHQAQEVLLESEQLFSAAFEFAPIGVALVSPDARRWLRANRALCELFGYSEIALQQRTVQEITHPDDAESSLAHVMANLASGLDTFEFEKRFMHRSGRVVDVLVGTSLLRDPHGRPVYFVSHVLDVTARKLAERDLRAINLKFHQLANNINDAFWIRSGDMKDVHYISPAFERIWGRSIESLYASPELWPTFIVDEDRDHVMEAYRHITNSAPDLDLEYRIIRPDGEIRWVHVRGRQVHDDRGVLVNIIGIVTDITDRKRAAGELQLERGRLILAQQVAKVGDWIIDLSTMVLQWSRETHRIFETDPESFHTYADVIALVHPEDREAIDAALALSISTLDPMRAEHRVLFPDGRVKYVEERWQIVPGAGGLPGRAVGTCQDISERKLAEIALRESQRRLRDLIDGLGPSMFVGLLTPEGIVVEVNRSPLEASAMASREVVGRNFADTDWWAGAPGVRQEMRDAIERAATGKASRFDVRVRSIDGKFIDLDFSLQPMFGERGEVIFLVPSATVITERKKAEAALRHSQKLEAVGQLAAGVAHEFNNILQTLMSMATITRIRAVSPEIVRIAGEMEVQLRRGATVTQQLLAASRHQELTRTQLNLCEQVVTTRDLLRRLIPENIAILVETCHEASWIEADAGQIQQVLLNLAINARDAMADGGTLTLRVDASATEVSLEVEDDGSGFDEGAREHIFEPFFTTKEVGKGTGLGLAVVNGIVEQHGGRIEARSQRGVGSVFRVTLPRTVGAEAVEPMIQHAPESTFTGRILLVEDEEGVREGLTLLLSMSGYEVTAVGRGEDAIALPDGNVPDMLLTDLSLPGIGGLALAGILTTRWPQLHVTLMTGYLEAPTRDTARDRGWTILRKPFDIDALTQHLALTLGTADPAAIQ